MDTRRSKIAITESNIIAHIRRESRTLDALTSGEPSDLGKKIATQEKNVSLTSKSTARQGVSDELVHLCERTRCELVHDNWIRTNKQPRHATAGEPSVRETRKLR